MTSAADLFAVRDRALAIGGHMASSGYQPSAMCHQLFSCCGILRQRTDLLGVIVPIVCECLFRGVFEGLSYADLPKPVLFTGWHDDRIPNCCVLSLGRVTSFHGSPVNKGVSHELQRRRNRAFDKGRSGIDFGCNRLPDRIAGSGDGHRFDCRRDRVGDRSDRLLSALGHARTQYLSDQIGY
jgi:hypothetical protein